MKKFIFVFMFLMLPMFASADGAFLNVGITVSNDNGGTFLPADFQYEINYNAGSTTKTDLLSGPIQAYGFPEHDSRYALVYSVTPIQKSSYTSKTSEKGCSGEIAANKTPLITCTIYQTDTGYPLPVVASSPAPTPEPVVVPQSAPVEAVAPVVVTLSPESVSSVDQVLIAELEQKIKLLLQLIDLMKQLIALQAQVNLQN